MTSSPVGHSAAPVTPQPRRDDVILCLDPATREPLGEIPVDDPAAVAAAVARARAAQRSWRKTTFAERRAVLQRILDYTVANKDQLCAWVQLDSGKTRENALVGEIWPVCEKLRWTIKNGEKHLKPEKVSSGLLVHKRARLEFHPLGVLAAIIPWNYPFQNIANPIIPALMAGNAVVIKPSEWVAWSSARFIDGFRQVLREAGHDPDLIQAVQGYGATGAALARAEVDTILFIGSVTNGRRVLEASTERVVPVTLELGGKDPFIVCDDADLEQAVHGALAGVYINCGQNCVSAERIIVHDGIYDAFERRVTELVTAFRQGSSRDGVVDVGAIITPLQLDVIDRAVQGAIAQGARVVCGGKRAFGDRGEYFEPTILADVTPEMHIMQEEVFGPVMLLSRVKDDAEAVAVANQISYALGSSVFSKDHARARRIASEVEAGMVAINEFGGITYMAQDLTFGGIKASGFGRMNGREGLRSMCNVKAVMEDRFPIHQPSKVFPVAEKDYGVFSGVIELIYGRGLKARWRGLMRLISGGKA
ncbi:MAG: aldehyde dehydrogenase family protein [Deltaproteobacteria bacterium]|nr:aldehyde dehydrogenase family protein [Deltaproteobacteria bacterium]